MQIAKQTFSHVGEVIRIARKESGLTQEQLAQKLHVSRQTVNYWETGKRDMYFGDFMNACHVLGIQLDIKIRRGEKQ